MNKIRTYHGLMEEKDRLEGMLVYQRERLRDDIDDIKKEIKPTIAIISLLGRLSNGRINPLLAGGAYLAGEAFLRNSPLSKAATVTRVVVPFLAKSLLGFFKKK